MKLLAIETSGDACSAALLHDESIISRFRIAPRQHADILLPMLDELLQESGFAMARLDGLAVGCGPGAFTGLRIATGVVQGLAFSADLPVALISTLTAMAQRGWREQGAPRVMAGFDARLNEVYWSNCRLNDQEVMMPVGTEQVCRPERVPLPPDSGDWLGLGSAWRTYGDVLSQRLNKHCRQWHEDYCPHAHDIAVLGRHAFSLDRVVSAEQVQPVYLRDNVASKSKSVG